MVYIYMVVINNNCYALGEEIIISSEVGEGEEEGQDGSSASGHEGKKIRQSGWILLLEGLENGTNVDYELLDKTKKWSHIFNPLYFWTMQSDRKNSNTDQDSQLW